MFDLPSTAACDASTALRKRLVDHDKIEPGIPIAGFGIHAWMPQN
ncbi:hypothetical protein [Streptomyces sp. NBC_01207]|nr:hypothetical protein OG457_48425 [Streptomyces sp. NBC_01207]